MCRRYKEESTKGLDKGECAIDTAIKLNIFFLGHTQVIYLGSKALHIIGVWDSKIIGTMHCDQLVIWSSVHLLLHQVDFICLVRPRLAEGETWLDSSRWGIAVQL